MSQTVSPLDVHDASDAELASLYDLSVAEHDELWWEDPMEPFEQWRKELDGPSWRKDHRWVTRDEESGRLLGSSTLKIEYTETNQDQASLALYVREGSRRRGLGAALTRPALELAETEGRTMLGGGGPTGTAGTDFADAVGAVCKIVERKSRMVLADVDRPMLEDWVARAKDRAAGYSMLAWDGPVPEEYLERFVNLSMVMNTAPRDDLQMEDWIHTPRRQREYEQRSASHGYTWWTLVVRLDATDELAGYTEFYFSPAHPEAAWQEATAVDPTHRDKGLGRWLKAVNALRLLDERPDIRYVDTWNAFSNQPMLGINIAMGFEVVKSYSDYQIPTAALKERLGR